MTGKPISNDRKNLYQLQKGNKRRLTTDENVRVKRSAKSKTRHKSRTTNVQNHLDVLPVEHDARHTQPAYVRNTKGKEESDCIHIDEFYIKLSPGKNIFEAYMDLGKAEIPLKSNTECTIEDIDFKSRSDMVKWMSTVSNAFGMSLQTYYLAVCYFDRILVMFAKGQSFEHSEFQLIAIACLFIATKLEDGIQPSSEEFCHFANWTYTRNEVRLVEKKLLGSMDWRMRPVTADNCLLHLCQLIGFHQSKQTNLPNNHQRKPAKLLSSRCTRTSSLTIKQENIYYSICGKKLFCADTYENGINIMNLALLDIGWLQFSGTELAVAVLTILGCEGVKKFTDLMDDRLQICMNWLQPFIHASEAPEQELISPKQSTIPKSTLCRKPSFTYTISEQMHVENSQTQENVGQPDENVKEGIGMLNQNEKKSPSVDRVLSLITNQKSPRRKACDHSPIHHDTRKRCIGDIIQIEESPGGFTKAEVCEPKPAKRPRKVHNRTKQRY